MAKTDKELTVEIVNTFVSSKFIEPGDIGYTEQLTALIKSVHETIRTLPKQGNY